MQFWLLNMALQLVLKLRGLKSWVSQGWLHNHVVHYNAEVEVMEGQPCMQFNSGFQCYSEGPHMV